MRYLLIYELVPDYVERRAGVQGRSRERAWDAAGRGELLLGGALDDPVDRAVLLFESDSPEAARAFARTDPYVAAGLVTRCEVRVWNTVAGEGASTPIRS